MLGEECEGELCEGAEELCEGSAGELCGGGVEERDEEERESEIEVLAGQSVGGRQKKKRKKLKTLTDKEKQSLMMREQVCHFCSTSCTTRMQTSTWLHYAIQYSSTVCT